MHGLYRDFRRLLDAYPGERVSIGELHHPDFERWAEYYGERQDEIHVPVQLPRHQRGVDRRRRASRGRGRAGRAPAGSLGELGPRQPRPAALRIAGREPGATRQRVGMLMLLTLRGTPTIYYGEEIGMVDVPVATADARDPLEHREPGRGRDGCRSPMQWDASPHAGFTAPEATPWLPLAPDAATVNVAAQRDDPDSLLVLTRDLLRLRREHAVLHRGDFERFGPTPEGTFAFRRIGPGGTLNVVLNLTDEPRSVPDGGPGRVLIGTNRDRDGATVDRVVELRPNEALVVEATG